MTKSTSTGNRSTGDYSTGNRSTGDCSTGDCSTGNRSTGDYSTGNRSTGDYSTGDCSTGNRSTGHYSTGDWSMSNFSSGHFSTEDYTGFGCFDKPCSKEEWDECIKPNFLYFDLTLWVTTENMTLQEKEENPNYKTTRGYLKVRDYQEAFKESYEKASKEDRNKVFNLPNFDADKFYEISGIDVRVAEEDKQREKTKQELIAKANELLAKAKEL